ncbi:MAG TPA: hypothetical protein VIF15_06290 [Polyangiaceae bacterium]|jgi:hypothetical protein
MEQQKSVRTYLDPDAVGPLPRSALADDSDALAAARTILRLPDSPTQEISADDVIEVVDPNRRNTSIAPVGYDTAELLLPRRRVGAYVVGAVVLACAVLVVVALASVPQGQEARATASAPAAPARAAEPAPQPVAVSVPTPASTTGTLRVDPSTEQQRVYVDGLVLSAPAAILRCGPHDVAVGSVGRTRTIDVPCGGEVTVFR